MQTCHWKFFQSIGVRLYLSYVHTHCAAGVPVLVGGGPCNLGTNRGRDGHADAYFFGAGNPEEKEQQILGSSCPTRGAFYAPRAPSAHRPLQLHEFLLRPAAA